MTHTCSELSLRILLWNASYVQTLPLRLTGRGRWSDPTKYQGTTVAIAGAENDQIESWPFPFPVQKILSKKSRLRQTCKPWNESVGERVLGLAGLAPCHSSKNNLQVRHGDQPWYPRVLWPLRWTIAHSTWMVPLQTYKVMEVKTYNREPEAQQVRSFTSLQMVHTHTPRCRMAFLEDAQPDTDQSSRSKCQLSAINDCLQRGKKTWPMCCCHGDMSGISKDAARCWARTFARIARCAARLARPSLFKASELKGGRSDAASDPCSRSIKGTRYCVIARQAEWWGPEGLAGKAKESHPVVPGLDRWARATIWDRCSWNVGRLWDTRWRQ